MIPKSTEADILRFFHAEKWPIGTIATELGIHHTTVQRVLRQSGVEPVVVLDARRPCAAALPDERVGERSALASASPRG